MARPPKDKEKAAIKAAEAKLKEELRTAERAADKAYEKAMRPKLDEVRALRAKAVANKNAAIAEAEATYYAGIAKLRQVK